MVCDKVANSRRAGLGKTRSESLKFLLLLNLCRWALAVAHPSPGVSIILGPCEGIAMDVMQRIELGELATLLIGIVALFVGRWVRQALALPAASPRRKPESRFLHPAC